MAEIRFIITLIKGLEWLDGKFKKPEQDSTIQIEKSNNLKAKRPENLFRLGVRKQNQRLTSWIGKLLERATYIHIGCWMLAIIFFCASLYFITGSNQDNANFGDYLYFSVITFTSLGYGDIIPLGIGKLIASLEVFSGIIMVAIFVGKVASERQTALLTLIYTSEHHRRIMEFNENVKSIKLQFQSALHEYDHDLISSTSQSAYKFISSLHNYLIMQANQGQIATFGNISTLRRLYKNLAALQQVVVRTAQTYGIKEQTRVELNRITSKINTLAEKMLLFHIGDSIAIGKLNEIKMLYNTLNKWKNKKVNNKPLFKYQTHLTEGLLLKIHMEMSAGHTQYELVDKIAEKLSITKSLARKGISHHTT